MIIRTTTDDDVLVQELDEEGIRCLADGLEQLLACEPGDELSLPTILADPVTGVPTGVAYHIIRRAAND